jgi:quinol monooxygenase YgiN
MSIMVMIRFPVGLEAQRELEATTDLMEPIREVAGRHRPTSHRRLYAEGAFVDLDEWPDRDAYEAFRREADDAIRAYEAHLGVASEATVWDIV